MNVKDEMNKAIGVLEARMDYIIKMDDAGKGWQEEYNALYKAVHSLEKWRDDSYTQTLPDMARQMIWFKQAARCESVIRESVLTSPYASD